MPAIRKGYRRIGGGALPRRILWAAGGMGVTVVANVLQKDGAHGELKAKTTGYACSRVGCAVRTRGILPTWSRASSLPVSRGPRAGRV